MTKTGKKRPSSRKLGGFGQKEREDERGRLDFTDYAPDPTLEDEYFGSFRPTTKDFSARSRLDGRYCSDGEFSRGGRGPRGWVHDPRSYGLADGQTPEFRYFLKSHGHRPKYRDKLAVWEQRRPRRLSNQIVFAFALQAIKQAEQKLPEVNPERDAAEDLDRRACRSNDRPFTPHNILHEERAQFYAQHTERRIQALLYRGYKPSKKLELKRLPTLKRIASNPLLTKDYLARGLRSIKDARRAECELLSARFLAEGGKVWVCAPEKTAEQIKKTAPRIGRPPIGDRPMTQVERKRRSRPLKNRRGRKPIGPIKKTNAERVRKHRLAKQLRALVAPERPQTGVGQPLPRGRPAPVNLSRKDEKA